MSHILVSTNQRTARLHPAQPDCHDDGTVNPGVFNARPELLDGMLEALDPLKNANLFPCAVPKDERAVTVAHVDESAPLPIVSLVHPESTVERFRLRCDEASRLPAESQLLLMGPEFFVGPNSFAASSTAVAAAIRGADALLAGDAKYALVKAGPPHHHSGPETLEGFCGFNGTAIAGIYLRLCGALPPELCDTDEDHVPPRLGGELAVRAAANGGNLRVAFFDADAHSGNGTVAALKRHIERSGSSEGVFFGEICTMTTEPSYRAYPSPKVYRYPENDRQFHREEMYLGTTGEEYLARFRETLFPKFLAFKPDVVVLSMGYDTMIGDQVGDLGMTVSTLYRLTRMFCRLGVPMLVCREGGYDERNNYWGTTAVYRALLGGADGAPQTRAERLIDEPYLRGLGLGRGG